MSTKKKDGEKHESAPEVAEFDNATESQLVLHAVRAALLRMNYACRVVIHTECSYVAAAVSQNWAEAWRRSNWKNSKEKDVRDAALWSMILMETEESGHQLEAVKGKHEWSRWMQWTMPLTRALNGVFKEIPKELQN